MCRLSHFVPAGRTSRRTSRNRFSDRRPRAVEALEPRTLLAASLLDPSFGGGDGIGSVDVGTEESAADIALLPDGKVLVAGTVVRRGGNTASDFALARFNRDGSIDTTFGAGGKVLTDFHHLSDTATAMAVFPDGRIVVVGSATRSSGAGTTETNIAVARYLASGTPDRSFDGDGRAVLDLGDDDAASDVVVMPDGDVVVAGTTSDNNGDFVAVRYNPGGTRDRAFGGDGIVTTDFTAADTGPDHGHTFDGDDTSDGDHTSDGGRGAALTSQGKLVVVGTSNNRVALAQYNADGSPDRSFGGGDGRSTLDDAPAEAGNAVLVLPDGDLLVAGEDYYDDYYWGYDTVAVARFDADGSPDNTFGDRGAVELRDPASGGGLDIAAAGDGTFLVATGFGVARITSDGATAAPFRWDEHFGGVVAVATGPAGVPFVAGVWQPSGDDAQLAAGKLKRENLPPDPDPDADDQAREATPLSAGGTRAGEIDVPSDVDMFRFTVAAGQSLALDVDLPGGSGLDPLLRVFDAGGQELAASDDDPAPGEPADTLEAYARRFFRDAGTYYAAVSGSPNDRYDPRTGAGDRAGSTGAFRVTLTDIPNPVDRDDQTSEAVALRPGSRRSGAIDHEIDVDLYRVDVRAGQRLAFDVDVPLNGLDARLRVFDRDGKDLGISSQESAPGETWDEHEAYAEASFAEAGTYYVGVSGADNDGYDARTGSGDSPAATGAYELVVTEVAPDPDDQISEAPALSTAGGRKTAAIGPSSDVDMYRFTAAAGQHVSIDLDRIGGGFDNLLLRLFTKDGAELASADDRRAPDEMGSGEGYIEFVSTAAGTYYVGVSVWDNGYYDPVSGEGDATWGSKADYRITLGTITPDPDDTLSEARRASLGSSVSGAVDTPTDVDVLRVDIPGGAKVGFDLDLPAGSALKPRLLLLNSEGNVVTGDEGGAAPGEPPREEAYVGFIAPDDGGGAYYLVVSGIGNAEFDALTGAYDRPASAGAYKLTLKRFAAPSAPDADDQIAEATTLQLGRPASGSIGEQDVDMYAFTVRAGDYVEAGFTDVSVNATLRLFDARGVAVEDVSGGGFARRFDRAGTYYLGVSGYENTQYDPVTGGGDRFADTGKYTLHVAVGTPPPGAIDGDDTVGEATALTLGTPKTGAIDAGADVDLYAFDAAAGTEYLVNIGGTDAGGRPDRGHVRVFAADGGQLAGDQGFVRFTPSEAGRYYVGVSTEGNDWYNPLTGLGDYDSGPTFGYALTVRAAPADPDDELGEATPLSLGSARSGRIDAYDVDVYAFKVTTGQRVGIDIDLPSDGGLDSSLRLFDARGNSLANNDDTPAPGEAGGNDSYIEHLFASAGTYYVAVSAAQNVDFDVLEGTNDRPGGVGAYTLRLSSPPPVA